MKTYIARFIFTAEDYLNDVQDIPRAFSPYFIIDNGAEDFLELNYDYSGGILSSNIKSSFSKEKNKTLVIDNDNILLYKKVSKHFLKNFLYDYISEFLNIKLPYGSLTGVRPTKLYYELSDTQSDPLGYLVDNYRVTVEKAGLIKKVVDGQKGLYEYSVKNVDIFVNIPFCPTRCSYCSFISCEVSKVKKELPDYVKAVRRELESIDLIIKNEGYKLRSIYVGGGTPTSIGAEYLDCILSPLKNYGVEFTVEAGRPDTISKEILDVLKKNNVTRISINPQTFNDKTLLEIGRKHTVEDIYKAYDLAKSYHFDINMDLIALLQGETFEDFQTSVRKALELAPENITVHTLSIKRGAVISDSEKEEFGKASEMVAYAHNMLMESGYEPYYMYRQKNMADNLENVGFARNKKFCIYNIDMMEETNTILAAGAGAMAKYLFENNRLERISNPKGMKEYLERIDEIIGKKIPKKQ